MYLFWGSWPAGKAWAGVELPPYLELYAALQNVTETSTNPRDIPWGDYDLVPNPPEWLEPVSTPPPPEVLEQEGEGKGSR